MVGAKGAGWSEPKVMGGESQRCWVVRAKGGGWSEPKVLGGQSLIHVGRLNFSHGWG